MVLLIQKINQMYTESWFVGTDNLFQLSDVHVIGCKQAASLINQEER